MEITCRIDEPRRARLLSESALGGPLSAGLLEDVERGVLRAIGVSID